jgi:dipeptidyl aminopeptidase/acylaminoacyl peptidase
VRRIATRRPSGDNSRDVRVWLAGRAHGLARPVERLTFDLYLKSSNRSGAEERLVDSPINQAANEWLMNGRWLLCNETNPTTGRVVWALDTTGPNRPSRVVANTPAEEVLAQFSPDGRWVAYQTNESGRYEVVVQPFPDTGSEWQVSTGRSVALRGRADGKEIDKDDRRYLGDIRGLPPLTEGPLYDPEACICLPRRVA